MSGSNRRQLLQGVGALAGAGALAGCSSFAAGVEAASPGIQSDGALERVLGHLDVTMAHLASGSISSIDAAVGTSEGAKRAGRAVRQALRALMMVGTFRGLTLDEQLHPGVQARMRASVPELDEAVGLSHGLVESLSADDRRELRGRLRSDPDFLMRVFGEVDREASQGGVVLANRLAMRRIVQHVSTRLRQSPDLFLDETFERVGRLVLRSEAGLFGEQTAAARVAEEALFRSVGARGGSSWGKVSAALPAGVYGVLADVPAPQPGAVPAVDRMLKLARRNMHLGAYLLGFGLVNAAAYGVPILVAAAAGDGGLTGSLAGVGLAYANPTPAVVGIIVGIALLVDAESKFKTAHGEK